MASSDKRGAAATSLRRYITFKNPTKTLHQSVNRVVDVRQWVFDSARVLDCYNDEGRSENWGPGWLCATIVQSPDGGSSGSPQGCMSVDISLNGDTEKVTHMFYRGNVVVNKTVSSVATAVDGANALLLTVVSDQTSLQVIRVENTTSSHRSSAPASAASNVHESEDVIESSAQPSQIFNSGFGNEERRREKEKSSSSTHDEDPRRKKFDIVNGSVHRERLSGSSSSGGSGSGGSGGSSSTGKQKERRRMEDECK